MSSFKQKTAFLDAEAALDIEKELQAMVDSPLYNTVSSYSTDTAQYPDNKRSFIEKHKHYIHIHPKLDAPTYISNLRLMTRIR